MQMLFGGFKWVPIQLGTHTNTYKTHYNSAVLLGSRDGSDSWDDEILMRISSDSHHRMMRVSSP